MVDQQIDRQIDRQGLFAAVHAAPACGPGRAAAAGRRGRALGRPVEPRAAQLPAHPPVDAPSPSWCPTAATTCTGATRCAPCWPSGPGCPRHPGHLDRCDEDVRTWSPAAPGAAARARRARHRRPRRGQRLLHRGAGRRPPSVGGASCPRGSPTCCWCVSTGSTTDARLVVRAAAVAGRRVPHPARARRRTQSGTLDGALRSAVEATCCSRWAATATCSGTRCSPRPSTTTCCPASGSACTRRTPGRCSRTGRRHRGRAGPHARAANDLVTAARASVAAGDEAMAVGGPDEAARTTSWPWSCCDPRRRRPTSADVVELDRVAWRGRAAAGQTSGPWRSPRTSSRSAVPGRVTRGAAPAAPRDGRRAIVADSTSTPSP